MAKGKSCKCKASECEECPEWIFTFADLVMLMMGFFVILWVLKPNPTKPNEPLDPKWLELVAKIREAFDYLPDPKSKDPVDIFMIMKKLEEMKPLKGFGDGGKTKLPERMPQGVDPEVVTIRKGKQAIVGSRVLFGQGDATLNADSYKILDEIAAAVRGHRTIFMVKGHASLDDLPESSDAQQKMDLSLRRAQVVSDYLIAHGVSPDILRVQGCSVFEPVVQRVLGADMRIINRRVEVENMATLVDELQDPAKPATRPVSESRLEASVPIEH